VTGADAVASPGEAAALASPGEAVAGGRSSGGAGGVYELGSTTGTGCVVEPGASVVGSVPTPASVAPCDVFGPICVGVPV